MYANRPAKAGKCITRMGYLFMNADVTERCFSEDTKVFDRWVVISGVLVGRTSLFD